MIRLILKNKKSLFSIIFLFVVTFFAFTIQFFSDIDPNYFDTKTLLEPIAPSSKYWLGTDDLGRDLLIRLLYGARISLLVGFVSVGISVVVGIIYGLFSGFFGGLIDEIMMRFVDLLMAIPTLFLILIIQVQLSPSIWNVMIVIGLTSWMGVARLVRAEVLSVKSRMFIQSVYSRGFSRRRILFKHILPHTLNPIIVAAMMGMGGAILTESVLSFLGLGVQPPQASWGNMLENSLGHMEDAPWISIFPGLMITLTVLSLNFIGDTLREVLNPEEHA